MRPRNRVCRPCPAFSGAALPRSPGSCQQKPNVVFIRRTISATAIWGLMEAASCAEHQRRIDQPARQ